MGRKRTTDGRGCTRIGKRAVHRFCRLHRFEEGRRREPRRHNDTTEECDLATEVTEDTERGQEENHRWTQINTNEGRPRILQIRRGGFGLCGLVSSVAGFVVL